jgi:hypothetical protein
MKKKIWKDRLSAGMFLLIILLAGWSCLCFVNLSLYEMTNSLVIFEGKRNSADMKLYHEFAQGKGDMET